MDWELLGARGTLPSTCEGVPLCRLASYMTAQEKMLYSHALPPLTVKKLTYEIKVYAVLMVV